MLRLVLLGAGSFALGQNTYIMAGLLPAMTQDLGISIGLAGQLISIFTIFFAAGGPVLTALIPARQARSVLLVALGLFILGNVATALALNLAAVTCMHRVGVVALSLTGFAKDWGLVLVSTALFGREVSPRFVAGMLITTGAVGVYGSLRRGG